MSRSKKLIILIVAFIVLLGSYFLVNNMKKEEEKTEEKKVEETIYVTDINKEDIEQVVVMRADESLVFKQKDEYFIIEGAENIKMLGSEIEGIVSTTSKLRAEKVVTDTSDNLKEYGLESPQIKVNVKLIDGSSQIINIGENTADNSFTYVSKDDESKVYIVKSYILKAFNNSIDEFRDRTLANIDPQNFMYMNINKKDERSIEVKLNEDVSDEKAGYGIGIFKLTKPYNQSFDVDGQSIQDVLSAMPTFQVDKFIEDEALDLKKYGLDDPSIDIVLSEMNVETNEVNTIHYLFGNEMNDEYIYFKEADTNSVYAMEKVKSEKFNIKPFDLISKLIYIVGIKEVDKIEVEGLDQKYEITIDREVIKSQKEPEEDEEVETFKIDGKEIEDDTFRKVYQSIIGVIGDFEVLEDFGDKETSDKVTIKYYLSDGTQKEIVYVPYNDNFYATKIENDVYFACAKNQIDYLFTKIKESVK